MSINFPSINLRTIGTYKIFTYLSETLSSFSSFQTQLSTIFGTNDLGTAYRSWNAATGSGILGTQFKPNSGYLLITRHPRAFDIRIDSGIEFDMNAYGIPISGTYTFLTYPYANQLFSTYANSLCTVFGLNDAETSYRSWNAGTGTGILGTQFKSNSGYLIVAKKPFWLLNPNYNSVPTNTPTNTQTATSTQTVTPTNTLTETLTLTPTNTNTETPTNTPTETPTLTPTNTPTVTPTITVTLTQTSTPTNTPTISVTRTVTPTVTTSENIDSDANAYIAAVEAADGTSLEPAIKTAISDFIMGLKTDDIWNYVSSCGILAGARTLAGALVPLKGTAPTNYNFVSADYDRYWGLKGDGASKYLDLNRNNNAETPYFDGTPDKHISVYVSTPPNIASRVMIGNIGSTIAYSRIELNAISTPYNHYFNLSNGTNYVPGNNLSVLTGFKCISRLTSQFYIMAIPADTATSYGVSSTLPLASANTYLFAAADAANNNAPTNFADNHISFYSIGKNLNNNTYDNNNNTVFVNRMSMLRSRVTTLLNAINAVIQPTPTPTPTVSQTNTPTRTATNTPTQTSTPTESSLIATPTPTITPTLSYDADALAYITAVEAADGQTLEANVCAAINDFVAGCKTDGIWNSIESCCILAGARTLAGALVPLKGTAPTNYNFVAADYSRSIGLKGNGSDKYLDLNKADNSNTRDNRHVSIYTTSNPTTNLMIAIKASYTFMAKSSVGIELSNSTIGSMQISSPFAGFKGMSRDNSSNFKFDYGYGSTTTQSVAANAQPLATKWFMFKDPDNSWLVSDMRMSFYSVGSSITLLSLRVRVNTLMNAFNILTPTNTPTPTQTATNTPTISQTSTQTVTPTNTITETLTLTPTNTSSSTPIPTATPTRTPSIPTVYVAGENYGTTFVPAPINQLDNITVKGELMWFNTIVGRDILTGKWFVDFTEQPGNWSKLSCGNSYIIALSAGTNKLFGKGSYAMGLLGIGSQQEFTQVPGDWSDFACGLSHTVAQSAGTNVWFGTGQWGAMSLGLGFGSTDGTGDNAIKDTTVLTQLSGQWSKMVCGQLTTFALSAGTDRWFATGINGSGNLGGLTPRPGYSWWGNHVDQFTILPYNWEKINCTVQHVFALSANTSKWFGWGRNNYDWWPVGDSRAYGALGLNNADYSRTTPTIIPGNWTDILPGSDHSCALSANTNKWFVAGKNNVGQLGTNNTTNTLVFTMVPGNWSKMYPGSTITVAVSAT